jgi:enoyl-CoA hydratase/carnithine racemase
MSTPVVLHEKRGAAFWITLNRPAKRNAINNDVIAGISEGISAAVADDDIHAIVLTGAGDKAFCAGGDLQPNGGFNFDFAQPQTPYGNLMRQAQNCPIPIIAAVNGVCVAGGMGLLVMVDMAVAVEGTRFGLPETKIGLFPMQVMSLMKDLVPMRILREWALSGELFDATEAKSAGLLNHIVPQSELHAKVDDMVAKLAKCSPTALRRGKYALRALQGMNFDQAISFAEGQLGLMTLTEDANEGLASFNEKRKPDFSGK